MTGSQAYDLICWNTYRYIGNTWTKRNVKKKKNPFQRGDNINDSLLELETKVMYNATEDTGSHIRNLRLAESIFA